MWENVQKAGAHEDAARKTGKKRQNPPRPPFVPLRPFCDFFAKLQKKSDEMNE
jgi:hypothetical protein